MSPMTGFCAVQTAGMMHKVSSLIFDLEVEENSKSADTDPDVAAYQRHFAERLAALMLPRTVAEYKLRADVDALMRKGFNDTAELAHSLSALRYHTVVRTALGGGPGVECITKLRHAFIICTPPGTPMRKGVHQFIVDPRFHDNFEIAKTTPRYAALLSVTPPVFVGCPESLTSVVSLLCAEMRDTFATLGATLPPWRHESSLMSKWQPRRSMDLRIEDCDAGAAAGGGVAFGGTFGGGAFGPRGLAGPAGFNGPAPMLECGGGSAVCAMRSGCDSGSQSVASGASLSTGSSSFANGTGLSVVATGWEVHDEVLEGCGASAASAGAEVGVHQTVAGVRRGSALRLAAHHPRSSLSSQLSALRDYMTGRPPAEGGRPMVPAA